MRRDVGDEERVKRGDCGGVEGGKASVEEVGTAAGKALHSSSLEETS